MHDRQRRQRRLRLVLRIALRGVGVGKGHLHPGLAGQQIDIVRRDRGKLIVGLLGTVEDFPDGRGLQPSAVTQAEGQIEHQGIGRLSGGFEIALRFSPFAFGDGALLEGVKSAGGGADEQHRHTGGDRVGNVPAPVGGATRGVDEVAHRLRKLRAIDPDQILRRRQGRAAEQGIAAATIALPAFQRGLQGRPLPEEARVALDVRPGALPAAQHGFVRETAAALSGPCDEHHYPRANQRIDQRRRTGSVGKLGVVECHITQHDGLVLPTGGSKLA